MKKPAILLASLAIAAASAFAQDTTEPNRLLINNTIGNYTGYVLDRIQEITFARVDGEVKANVEISDVQLDQMTVSITKTESCLTYYIDILPATMADKWDDLAVISYVERSNPTLYFDDYTNATLTGVEFKPATDYVLVTIGRDGYGVSDGVVRAPFTTPKPEIVGKPEVKAEVVDQQLKSFSIKFTPNDDVSTYYCVAGEKGTLMEQYEFFASMMGLTSFTDMIISWGLPRQGENIVNWTDMAPNTEYDVYYVALDINGTPADYQLIEVSTLALGGDGEAKVDIEILEYEYADWYGEMLPSQYIGFTPNDQASCYRLGVYLASSYDPKAEEIKTELKTDPWMPTANWFFYEPMVTDFQINPNTECVAIAAAKNGNGEWGEVTEVRFTTPEEAEGKPEETKAPKAGIADIKNRIAAQKTLKSFHHEPGKAPSMPKAKKLQLN